MGAAAAEEAAADEAVAGAAAADAVAADAAAAGVAVPPGPQRDVELNGSVAATTRARGGARNKYRAFQRRATV